MTHNLEIKANVSIEFSRTGDTQYELNKQIRRLYSLNISFNDIFESFFLEDSKFPEFLSTKIGPAWLHKEYGKLYLNWQESV